MQINKNKTEKINYAEQHGITCDAQIETELFN